MKTIALIWAFAGFAMAGSAVTVALTPAPTARTPFETPCLLTAEMESGYRFRVQARGEPLPGLIWLSGSGMVRTDEVRSMAVVCGDADPFDDPEGTRDAR